MKASVIVTLGAAAIFVAVAPAMSHPDVALPGQKLDSGLGELPHYSKWVDPTGRAPMGNRVLGESLDDGLGEMPHYSKWVDRSGRDPMGRQATVATAKR